MISAFRSGIVGLVLSVGCCAASFAQPAPMATGHSQQTLIGTTAPPTQIAKPSATARAWQQNMLHTPAPKAGCFKSVQPNRQWQEIPCSPTPNRPMPIKARPEIVGSGVDYTVVAQGVISSVTGSFDEVVDVVNPPTSFSLQLNTNIFTASPCGTQVSCDAWEQFIYSDSTIYIQYWSFPSGDFSCEPGWIKYAGDGGGRPGCFRNGQGVGVGALSLTDLGSIALSGTASTSRDTVTMALVGAAYSTSDPDDMLHLAQSQKWKTIEFGIFGNGGGSQVALNPGATFVVKTWS